VSSIGSPRSQPAERAVHDTSSLFQRHAATVARWVRRLGGPGIDAEDAVQEVFLVAHRRLDDFAVEAKLKAWLFRTTVAVVRSHRRKLRWRRLFPWGPEERELASEGPTPLEELERRRLAAATYRWLDRLPEKHRAVLVLFEVEGRSGEEIGELLGVKVATVWVWLHRARARFLAIVQAEGGWR
jgi:RNA polymerase sigma-70 factor, ECF subfamily